MLPSVHGYMFSNVKTAVKHVEGVLEERASGTGIREILDFG